MSYRRSRKRKVALCLAGTLDDMMTIAVGSVLLVAFLFTVWTIADISAFNSRGMTAVKYRDFDELKTINPDVTAWLRIDNTHINYPVVQGKDNFEYLDMDFRRDFYAGGTLFLDAGNSKDFSDMYSIIHGHHMAEGAMFGDLDKFMDEDFFEENRSGILLTPQGNYRLEIAAAGTADAYDYDVYSVDAGQKKHIQAIKRCAEHIRGGSTGEDDDPDAFDFSDRKILVLSTCTSDMDDSRTVVFCVMKYDSTLESAA